MELEKHFVKLFTTRYLLDTNQVLANSFGICSEIFSQRRACTRVIENKHYVLYLFTLGHV